MTLSARYLAICHFALSKSFGPVLYVYSTCRLPSQFPASFNPAFRTPMHCVAVHLLDSLDCVTYRQSDLEIRHNCLHSTVQRCNQLDHISILRNATIRFQMPISPDFFAKVAISLLNLFEFFQYLKVNESRIARSALASCILCTSNNSYILL